jgi:4-hydroxybenzoyl-CoA thioesterase
MPAGALPVAAFRSTYRVRFHDCDPAGIVFFGAWFSAAHGAVEDFLDYLGVPFHVLNGPRRVATGMAHVAADYFRPGFAGDLVSITPLVARIGGGSYALVVHIHRDDAELARLALVTATTDLDRHRPVRVPDDLRAALAAYQERCAA